MATNHISLNTPTFASDLTVNRQVIARKVPHDIAITAQFIDRDKCDSEDIAEVCSEAGPIRLAVEARALAEAEKPVPPEAAVYIIGPKQFPAICKIGVAENPAKRLAMLQVGCWDELTIRALFWCVEGSAFGIEKLSLRIAAKMGMALRGEWVSLDSAAAAYVVGSVIHSSAQVKVCDSSMWLRHRADVMRQRARLIGDLEDADGPDTGFNVSNLDRATITSFATEPASILRR